MNYEMDLVKRYEHGEFFSQDSIKQDHSTIYYTANGRPVYGGGGPIFLFPKIQRELLPIIQQQ